MTTNALDTLAHQNGGYVAAAQQEYDIAAVFEGLGDPETDQQAAYHRTTAQRLLERLATLTEH